MTDTTVEVNRMALATLIDETQNVVDSISDPEWHEGHGEDVKKAIEIGEEALEEEGER